jgi:hypothetical protein
VRRRRLFTRHDVWLGSFYELAIELGPRSDERLAAASAALWRHPALEGPYRDHTREPWEQEIVSPSLVVSSDVVMHLYGAATLPDGHQVAAGSVAVREDESGIDWLDLYTPLGALETIYDIGYPYDESWRVWAEPLVRWFADIGRWIYHEVAFRRGLIGEEVSGHTRASEVATAPDTQQAPVAAPVPNERGELDWYPTTDWWRDSPRSFPH